MHFGKNARHTLLTVLIMVGFVGAFFISAPAHAQVAQSQTNVQQTATAAGIAGGTDLVTIIGRIINIVLGTVGVILLVLLLYAGFLWMTSGGADDNIKKAKAIIRNALIGLVIITSAWAITAFILNALAGVSSSGGLTSTGAGGLGVGLVRSSGSLGQGIIEYHIPERNATGVPRNTSIAITFKQPIQPASFIAGWTTQNASTTSGLNADLISIYKTGDTATALTSAQARVSFTADHKTFVIRPVDYLGSATANTKYTVKLKGGSAGILLDSGGAAFGGSFSQGYEWGFEVSTVVDLTPPKLVAAIPYTGGKYARNIVIQMTFNKAIDPVSASGVFKNGSGFTNIEVKSGPGATTPINGEFKITNRYQTVEFTTDTPCGTNSVNSCGKAVYCLPGDASIETTIRAATLSSQPPTAQFSSQGYDGIVDVVGNSFDGNSNDVAEGSPADNYTWTFATSNDVKLSPPKIVSTVPDASPGVGQSNRPLDETVTATFDSLMQTSTFNSDAAKIMASGPGETDPDTFWYAVGMNLLAADGTPVKPGEQAAKTQLTISHRPYLPSGATSKTNNYYNPFLYSDIQDAYQNCFNPGSSSVCNGAPNCCNNSPKSPDCVFTP